MCTCIIYNCCFFSNSKTDQMIQNDSKYIYVYIYSDI